MLKLGVNIDQLKVLQNLADRLPAPGLLLQDFLHLQIVDEIALFDQRQQWVGIEVRHTQPAA